MNKYFISEMDIKDGTTYKQTFSIDHTISKYPDGAIKVLYDYEVGNEVTIEAHITDNDGLIGLFLITDALRRLGVEKINLFIPYVPYCRQDRICNEGESLSSKVIADLINLQNYNYVTTFDAHSNVIVGMLNKCNNISNCEKIFNIMANLIDAGNFHRIHLIAPDLGAVKKLKELISYIEDKTNILLKYSVFDKKRDTTNGKLSNVKLMGTSLFADDDIIFVVDDICDGGGTFLLVHEILESYLKDLDIMAHSINLIVSHGLYTNKDNLTKLNELYTNNLCIYNYSK